jgi:hypothetical protein
MLERRMHRNGGRSREPFIRGEDQTVTIRLLKARRFGVLGRRVWHSHLSAEGKNPESGAIANGLTQTRMLEILHHAELAAGKGRLRHGRGS